MSRFYYLLVGAAVFAADQVTKLGVTKRLPFGETIEYTSWFSLVHWRNRGGVWGLFQDLPAPISRLVFLALPIIGIAVISILFYKTRRGMDRLLLAAVLGAAAGNVADRIRMGAVVDFLDFHWPGGASWPAFNVADAVLSCAVALLLIRTFFIPEKEEAHAPHPL